MNYYLFKAHVFPTISCYQDHLTGEKLTSFFLMQSFFQFLDILSPASANLGCFALMGLDAPTALRNSDSWMLTCLYLKLWNIPQMDSFFSLLLPVIPRFYFAIPSANLQPTAFIACYSVSRETTIILS